MATTRRCRCWPKARPITGRLWTYVRDDRPFGGPAPPAAIFYYSRDRAASIPPGISRAMRGILQADAYAGFNDLYDGKRKPGPITEAACWAHGRRKLFVLADTREGAAGDRGGAPDRCDLRRRARHQRSAADQRLAVRQERIVAAGRRARRLDACRARQALAPRRGRQGDGLHAQALGGLHPLPRRWPHLPDQQCRRAGTAWHRARPQGMAVRRLRSRRRAGGGDVFADRHRQTQRRRSARLARRRARPDQRPSSRRLDELLPWNWKGRSAKLVA